MWEVHHHTYKQGKCDECGKEGKIQITDGVGRCPECSVKWLMEKATK